MPTIHTFTRSDNDILEELLRVFSSGRGTSREQWCLQAEVLVEPVGWIALWKLSKMFCKKFEVRFPCVAVISVTSVDFENLSANVDVLSVQHEAVSLPEAVTDVPLMELWPTVKQQEECVNAASTAEFIDLLRFFYLNIWMPWDDQDDKVLLPNTIQDRMSLWTELHNGTIPSSVARSIQLLRDSAINASDKLKELDTSLCEVDLTDDDDSLLPANYISQCAEMNARLDCLMSKWTLYENPLIRKQYLAKIASKMENRKKNVNVVALWEGGDKKEFESMYKFLQSHIREEQVLSIMVSAEEGLSLEPEEVVICSNEYELPEMPLSHISIYSYKGATLKAADMRSCLLMLTDSCNIRDITLDCAQVNTIIVMKAGSLQMKNCKLSDDSKSFQSDFAQGIVAMAGAKLVIEDCIFENFYSGIVVHKGAEVTLRNCVIQNCGVGIQMYSESHVKLDNTTITGCTEQSIRCEFDVNDTTDHDSGLQVLSNCKIGSGNLKQEVYVVNQETNLM
ncbi:protein nessun dorma [Aricia agestis]|uniref:protein nessun dorma n=1 Tax=Aricia agestis TaxID=91739 RepID=UPI001C208FCF|nr:protein nessun dorma [Aricia agestis]XP_041972079.1 protein nessun dorma [Aricia agestis]